MTLEEYIEKGQYRDVRIISSYHNHNELCGHAGGKVIDYAKVAEEKGYINFGISDHGPMPGCNERMSLDAFYNVYLPEFKDAEGLHVNVRKGLELEFEDSLIDYYRKLKESLDYLVLGQHWILKNGKRKFVHVEDMEDEDYIIYRDTCIRALNTGLFSIFAHPGIMFYRMEKISPTGLKCLEDVVKEAVRLNIVLEVNANGIRRPGFPSVKYRYPRQEYLDLLKKYNARCIVSDDAHNPLNIWDDATTALYSYLLDEGYNLVMDPKF